jgi:hypothetical protein
MSPPPVVHFGAYLSPIHEASFHEEQDEFDAYNQEAMEPLTFLPEVDSMPLMSPIFRENIKHPGSPFQPTPSAEDLSILSGITPSEEDYSPRNRLDSNNRSWSGKLRGLLWSLGASALATISGESSGSGEHSNSRNSIAALEQWPSTDHMLSGDDEDWENVEKEEERENNGTSLDVGFPFSSNSFTFGSAEPPEPLFWE